MEIKKVIISDKVKIYFDTGEDININTILCVVYQGINHYFSIIEMSFDHDGCLVIAEECGYYKNRLNYLNNICYFELIGKEITIVEDEKKIEKIRSETERYYL